MDKRKQSIIVIGLFVIASIFSQALFYSLCAQTEQKDLHFEIQFPENKQNEPFTGRLFLIVTRTDDPEPRLQVGGWRSGPPLFGFDVNQLDPGSSVIIDKDVLGYPLKSLAEIPAGDYYMQALYNKYIKFERSDGHTIWAHMDQWEGQKFNRSPGNLISDVQKIQYDPAAGFSGTLSLTKVIPPVAIPKDTKWVKRIKIKSELLSEFWGRPIYLGATVLLPKGYETHPDVFYPVEYIQDHFNLRAPHGFQIEGSYNKKS